jgi:hypothetical protein
MKTKLSFLRSPFSVLLLAAAVAFSGCNSDDDEPQLNIVRLQFGFTDVDQPTIEQVQEALTNGADSVKLVSMRNFSDVKQSTTILRTARKAEELTAVSPRVRGEGHIHISLEVAEGLGDYRSTVANMFFAAGFDYNDGR